MKNGTANDPGRVAEGAYGHRVVPRVRLVRWLLMVFGAVAVAGGGLMLLTQFYLGRLQALAGSDPQRAAEQATWLLGVVLSLTLVSAIGIGAFVTWYGFRTLRGNCFPPPGAWVIEGQVVQVGVRARRLGWLQIGLGLGMSLAVCALVLRVWFLLYSA